MKNVFKNTTEVNGYITPVVTLRENPHRTWGSVISLSLKHNNPGGGWGASDRAPHTTISTEPLTWAISCIWLFSTDQHYTPHAELAHFMVLFNQGCLSCLSSTFLSPEQFTHTTLTFWADKSAAHTTTGQRRLECSPKSLEVWWTKAVTQWS